MSEPMVHKDKSGTLQAKNPTAVVYEAHDTPLVYQTNQTDARIKDMGDTCQTVIARWGTGGNHQPLVQQSIIRRLTPVECERLQGFPDNYTQIPWKGKAKEDCPDSHRYKALGNAMAVPVIQFLGKNIVDYERKRNEER
jgi:site-specific DNA-cytosine methylase